VTVVTDHISNISGQGVAIGRVLLSVFTLAFEPTDICP